jgi:hypothetical protein
VIAIGVAAPLAAVMVVVVAGAVIEQRLAGHHATGAMMGQAGPGARLMG